MSNIIDADSARKLAGLQIDLLQKFRAGQLTLEQLNWFLGLSVSQREVFAFSTLDAFSNFFPAWRTVKLGTGLLTGRDFHTAFAESSFGVSVGALRIFDQPAIKVIALETEVTLVLATPAELGFSGGAALAEIYMRAGGIGLELCPPEVGPQLRLQYPDQPEGEHLIVGMDPVVSGLNTGGCFVFGLVNKGGGLLLSVTDARPDHVWDAGRRFVFVRPE